MSLKDKAFTIGQVKKDANPNDDDTLVIRLEDAQAEVDRLEQERDILANGLRAFRAVATRGEYTEVSDEEAAMKNLALALIEKDNPTL